MSDQELDHARDLAKQLYKRVKNEQGFKEKLQRDPQGTLTAAGLPEQYIASFLREAELTDVAGYKADTCLLTCIIWSI